MNRIRNEQGHIITDTREIQDIIREGFKNAYPITLEKKMNTFLDLSKLPKLNQEESNNINRPMTEEEIGRTEGTTQSCLRFPRVSHGVCDVPWIIYTNNNN